MQPSAMADLERFVAPSLFPIFVVCNVLSRLSLGLVLSDQAIHDSRAACSIHSIPAVGRSIIG
jgi:hypothetical protein